MDVLQRLASEQEFHDRQSRDRARRLADVGALRLRDADYLDHEPWIRPALDRLGDVATKRILDLGCGHGMASVVLARRGAIVTGVDLSSGYVEEARRRAAANEVVAEFCQADAEHLPFANESFDAVWGCAILHHLDLQQACRELLRVLSPGGIAVFCEPWGGNPLIEFGRRYLPYPGKHRTPDERPLRPKNLDVIREYFPRMQIRGYQLFGTLRRAFRRESPAGGWLDRCDARLLRHWPALEKFARYVVISLLRE
jgi:SAM-dependent methyltransferase